MADKDFGAKRINLIGATGTPTITSPTDLIINANKVAISTNFTVGGSIGVGTTNPTSALTVLGNILVSGATTTQTLNVGTGGTVITTTSAGLVGIGTTNPLQKLHIRGNSYITGNLGIGIANPTAQLHITADASINDLTIGRGGGNVSSNTALGYRALLFNTSGSVNTATGTAALEKNTTGNSNTATGNGALANNTTGSYNAAFGQYSQHYNITGNNNTTAGGNSLYLNTTGSRNTAIGYETLYWNTTGSDNIAIGYETLYNNVIGSNNIGIGNSSGISTSASNKIIIGSGYDAFSAPFDSPDPDKDYQFAVGIRTDDYEDTQYWLVGNENFNIGIGTTNPTSKLSVGGDGYFVGVITASKFFGQLDAISASGQSVGFATTAINIGSGNTGSLPYQDAPGSTVFLSAPASTNQVLLYSNGTNQPVWSKVGLGTNTTGNYVKSISSTANEIEVTGGTGEGSTPTVGFANSPIIQGTLQVNTNLNVLGNITIGGTANRIIAQDLVVQNKDIILGFSTDIAGNEVSTDFSATGGGIAIASTEGSPLVNINAVGFEDHPSTYKKIMWFRANDPFIGLKTDAWLSNYAFGIGTTSMPVGTRFAAGNVTISQDDITSVGNINASGISTLGTVKISSGIVTATSATGIVTFYGNFVGTATSAGYATTAFNLDASVTSNLNVAYATSAGISTYTSEWILGAVGNDDYTFTGPGFTGAESDPVLYLVRGQQYKFTNTMGMHPFRIQSTPNGSAGTEYNDGITNNNVSNGTLTWNVQFDSPGLLYYQCTAHGGMGGKIYIIDAGIGSDISVNTTGIITASSFIGIALSISGISTLGTVKISSGIVTSNTATGIVTYYGDGSKLSNIISGVSISTNTTNQSQYLTYTTGTGSTTGFGITTTGLVFNPSTGNLGIETTNPTSKLWVNGDGYFTGILTANRIFSGTYGEFVGGSISGSEIVGTALSISGISTLGTVKISSGIITATTATGIVTYYGDGSKLTDVSGGIGIASDGIFVGSGVTYVNFAGPGVNSVTYSSSGIATITISSSQRAVNKFTATEGQTTFNTLYEPGFIDVYLNGSRLTDSEYNATNGTSIILFVGASVNDVIETVTFSYLGLLTKTTAEYAIVSSSSSLSQGLSGIPNINVGIVTATKYYGDGSSLTGISAGGGSGGSIQIRDRGVLVGTAITTIDFSGVGFSTIATSSGISTIVITGSQRTVNSFTATEGQTNFSATYAPSAVDVYLNGVRINLSEYTAIDGSTIVLSTGASLNDVIEVVSFTSVGSLTQLTSQYSTTSGVSTSSLGLTGTPNIVVGIVTASNYYGNGSNLSNVVGQVSVSNQGTFVGSGITVINFVGTGVSSIVSSSGIATVSFVGSQRNTASFVATAGQTVFTTSYTVGYVDVYKDGTRLSSSQYAATDGVTVVLSSGATVGQVIDIISATNVISNISNSNDTRLQSVSEKINITSGNTVSLVYNTGSGNVGLATNPTGDITLNVTGIPIDSSFDSRQLKFSVIVTQTGIARSCTAITLNGVSRTIRWSGGSLSGAITKGGNTNNGYDIYNFIGINTIGSASTTTNYIVLGSINGGFS